MRSFFEDYKIDGMPILAPDAEIAIEWNDLDAYDAGRDESGVMHRHVLRYRVPKWSFSYAILTREELAYMRGLLKGKATFSFSYKDEEGNEKTRKAYCSNDSVTWFDSVKGIYRNYQIHVIAC